MRNLELLMEKVEDLNRKVDALTDFVQNDQPGMKRWLRTHEVCEYLSISSSQLQVLKNEGIIEAVKLGGTNYYDRYSIDSTLEELKQEVRV